MLLLAFMLFCVIIKALSEERVFYIKKKNHGKRAFFLTLASLICLYLLTYIFNFIIEVNTYKIKSPKVNKKVRVALITDLHNSRYGKSQKNIIRKIDAQKPDIILLSGDIAEDYKGNENAFELVTRLADKYPCYYVSGNHECRSGNLKKIKDKMKQCGAVVLEGEGETIEINGQKINICGVDDYFIGEQRFIKQLDNSVSDIDMKNYTILISHRPDLERLYTSYDFDLIVSGHQHGGQWRIPYLFENGLVAPDGKFLPEYTTGKRTIGNSQQIVSRGLSKLTPPLSRVFNSPEVIIIDIEP